jgi:hypothetical protein
MKILKTYEFFNKKTLSIGDPVKVTSLEGEPVGIIYDIFKGSNKLVSYWVDLVDFGKMEFSDFELKKMSDTEVKNNVKLTSKKYNL